MKILGVRFKNLNSLKGEWDIDFSLPAYSSDGIFAITGPTGAGKTTILDAICVALYGQTPRLRKITKSTNEIMSRHTGECLAEVCFESGGRTYRCHWSQRRARKRSEGELQNPDHELFDVGRGEILAKGVNRVESAIIKITGMDFDQFTRSMLLAQGGFAAFLEANAENRAPILEQITGTEIYSQISIKVFERQRLEKKKLETDQISLAGIRLLEPAELEALQGQLASLEQQEAVYKENLREHSQALQRLTNIIQLEQDLVGLEGQLREVQARQQAFEPEARRLQQARKALNLQATYAELKLLRQAQQDEQLEATKVRERQMAGQEQLLTARECQASASQEHDRINAEAAVAADLIRQVRDLDIRIEEKKLPLKQLTGDIERLRANLSELEKAINQGHSTRQHLDEQQQLSEAYLREHHPDAGLQSNLSLIERLCRDGCDAVQQCTNSQALLTSLRANLSQATVETAGRRSILEQHQAAADIFQLSLAKLEQDIQQYLQDRPVSEWRQQQAECQKQLRRLQEARESARLWQELNVALPARASDRERYIQLINEGQDHLGLLEEQGQKWESEIAHLEKILALQNQIRNLEESRQRLLDGEPCPLCGALHHPYAEGNIPHIDSNEHELAERKRDWQNLRKKLDSLKEEIINHRKDKESVERDMGKLQQDLNAAQMKYIQQLEELGLDLAIITNGADMIDSRVVGLSSTLDAINELLARLEKSQEARDGERRGLEKAREDVRESENALHRAESAEALARSRVEYQEQQDRDLQLKVGQTEADILRELAAYGISSVDLANSSVILKELQERQTVWSNHQAARDRHAAQISEIEGLLASHTEKRSAGQQELQNGLEACSRQQLELDGLVRDRTDRMGEGDPNQEEERWRGAVESARLRLNRVQDELAQAQGDLTALERRQEELEQSLQVRGKKLEEREQAWGQSLSSYGFENESAWEESWLNEDECSGIMAAQADIERELAETQALLHEKASRLQTEKQAGLQEYDLSALQNRQTELEALNSQTSQEIGSLRQKRDEDQMARERYAVEAHRMQAQERTFERWDRLNQLIGSRDGKAYRNFAQTITFEILIEYANRQLQKLNDRYILCGDPDKRLELYVIDQYQAGEIRSTKNLSGGEGFLVSLALALGLSQMASRKVQVDSLFLDEGFGTLDEDSLEAALETLAAVQREGKLIGLISHVPALKERINTQIQVNPQTGGRSVLSGPGCRRVN